MTAGLPVPLVAQTGGSQFYITKLTEPPGQNPEQITASTVPDQDEPLLAPDGSLIAYVLNVSNNTTRNICTVNPDGTNQQTIYDSSHPDYANVGSWLYHVSWHPDSSKLVFATAFDSPNWTRIYTIPAAGGSVTTLYSDPSTRAIRNPAYNYDGSKIAFIVDIGGGQTGYWTMNADGTGAAQIATSSLPFIQTNDEPPFAWMRSQSKLVIRTASNTWRRINDDGTGALTLLTFTNVAYPSSPGFGGSRWLPDDSGLLRAHTGATSTIVRVAAADGSGETNLIDLGVFMFGSRVRVIGSRIYFVIGGNDTWSCTINGTDLRNETSGTSDTVRLSW